MTGKAFWKSKVLWFNVLALVVAVANLVLRLFTQQPVGLRDA